MRTSSTRTLPTNHSPLLFSSRKSFAGAQRAGTAGFTMLQALKKMQLGNAVIYQLVFCPKVPVSQKKLCAIELESVDLVFSPWKGSRVTLLLLLLGL